jgi:ubiquinone/menaquinone biosynthesis C-methylase UbiE
MIKNSRTPFPPYLTNIYGWLYLRPRTYKLFDNKTVQNILTLGANRLLINELKKEILPHSNILQIGVTFGNQIEETYEIIKKHGAYTVIDIIPALLKRYQEKNSDKRIHWVKANAAKEIKGNYDIIICPFLLHELPPLTRAAVLENIINALSPQGKAVFIDYHLPSEFNPLKYFIRAFNRLYQPFAEELWKNSIRNLTPNKDACTWSMQSYYGGMYQKVVATKNI